MHSSQVRNRKPNDALKLSKEQKHTPQFFIFYFSFGDTLKVEQTQGFKRMYQKKQKRNEEC